MNPQSCAKRRSGSDCSRAGSGSNATRRSLIVSGRQPTMMFTQVQASTRRRARRDLAEESIPVTVTCRSLGFSQGFYRWKKSPITRRDSDNAYLINAAYDIHADDPGFGYRFIADELPSRGIIAKARTVSLGCVRSNMSGRCSQRRRD